MASDQLESGSDDWVEGDVFESYYDPFDIDDGENVETSKAYQTLDQCMKTEIDGIIGRLINDERIQGLLGQKEKSKMTYDKKIGSRQKGVFEKQSKIANDLLQKIKGNASNFQDFQFFDFYIFVPKFKNLGKQTIDRLKDFIEENQEKDSSFLQNIQQDISDSRVEDHVIRNIKTKECKKKFHKNEETKMMDLKKRVIEEEKTLFFIVHDEAHFAPVKGNLVDQFINDPVVACSPNLILLQVSATPYCLLTKNSRIPEENCLNWFSKEDSSDYFGIKDFVENTLELGEIESDQLEEGTMRVDSTFEENIADNSDFEKYLKHQYKKCNAVKPGRLKKSEKCDVLRAARLHGLIMQYMKGLLEKANIPSYIYEPHFQQRSEKLSLMTKMMLRDIDKFMNGKGKMILLRVMEIKDGIFFAYVLRQMRALLKFDDRFSVVLDIDSEDDRKSGMDNFLNTELRFLERIQCWNDAGNTRYRPSSYKDLNNLPVILIVCERGKMGITYPPSLRWYDLRLRYSTLTGVTRGAVEQDFGRACRYKSSDELPTILVSRVAYKRLFPRKRVKAKKTVFAISSSNQRYSETVEINDSNGIYKLDPDYPDYMKKGGAKKQFPNDDLDLTPYKSWIAAKEKKEKNPKEHCDYGNLKLQENRYLLVGRPQIGKTGAFMHLAFLIWDKMKRPKNTGPREVEPIEIIEFDEDITEAGCDEVPSLFEFERYPEAIHIKSLKLKKPSVSPRYGDPNDMHVQKWYLEDGKTYPFPECLKTSSLIKRMEPIEKHLQQTNKNSSIKDNFIIGSKVKLERVNSEFCAKSLLKNKEFSVNSEKMIKDTYFCSPIKNCGLLLRNKKTFEGKWKSSTTLELDSRLQVPPILTPSSGRASSALLDLRETMEGNKYAHILLIRNEEALNYLEFCISHDNIDILALKKSEPHTIGTSRYFAKKFGELITASSNSKFIFIQDDNILSWTGVTLINDPFPQFNKEPNCRFAQQTDISLLHLLSHMKADNYQHIKDFSIIGFSLTKRTIKSRINAYARSHVFGAVLLNLSILSSVEYNRKAWAMEDIDFNWKTNDMSSPTTNNGLIVKCMRYVGSKKKIIEGGVVPKDIPNEIFPLLQSSTEWNVDGNTIKNVLQKATEEKRRNNDQISNIATGTGEKDKKNISSPIVRELLLEEENTKLKERNESFEVENIRLKRQLQEMKEMYEKEKMGREQLVREIAQNNVEQDTEINLSNRLKSVTVYQGSLKRKLLQGRKSNIETEEKNSEQKVIISTDIAEKRKKIEKEKNILRQHVARMENRTARIKEAAKKTKEARQRAKDDEREWLKEALIFEESKEVRKLKAGADDQHQSQPQPPNLPVKIPPGAEPWLEKGGEEQTERGSTKKSVYEAKRPESSTARPKPVFMEQLPTMEKGRCQYTARVEDETTHSGTGTELGDPDKGDEEENEEVKKRKKLNALCAVALLWTM